ncbi:MAG: flagellar motor protein [Peptococcaceae bacterium]|jgi:chemotaxis protein MotA|nr:flagellar motor protein [Peptococcaceae bacterium]MDH7525004.1 flagellar motor protein [Peptococcaceae bacterium]
MDIATLLGISIALIGVIGGYLYEGGALLGLFSVASALIVLGATIGAVFISLPLSEIKEIPKLIKLVLTEKDYDYNALIKKITELAHTARKEGILALESLTQEIDYRFLANGIMMVVDGMDKEATKSIMEAEISSVQERHFRRAKIFDIAGGYCPTMGIMGTVMSMISVLKELNEPAALGPKIAMAFTATLYGVGFANVLFFPIAEKLKAKSHAEMVYMEICMEGVLSIQAGESPKIISEKLLVFINQGKREEEETETKKEEEQNA